MGCLCGVVKANKTPVEEVSEPKPKKKNEKSKSTPPPEKKTKEKESPRPKRPPPPPPPPPPKLPPPQLAAKTIQAWWRGTLVRRTLLTAALNAWIIQCWWRQTLATTLKLKRMEALCRMARETRACVTIQSWFRMLQVRRRYRRLRYATHIIQVSWRWYNCHTRGYFEGSYEITGDKLSLRLDIFLGSQVCRISDCISLPIKN
nr:IQ domain-containing protein F5-like isoform X1 [Peromyscus maniculatus bairdii]